MAPAKPKNSPAAPADLVALVAIEPIRSGEGDIAPGETFTVPAESAEALLALGHARADAAGNAP